MPTVRLNPDQIKTRLTAFLETRGGHRLGPQLMTLLRLFRHREEAPRAEVEAALSEKGVKTFRVWRNQVNQLFEQHQARIAIQAVDSRLGEAATVWFEGPIDPLEEFEQTERQSRERDAYMYQPKQFDPVKFTFDFPALRFPSNIKGLLDRYRDEWDTSEEIDRFLCGTTIKLEPIVPLDPAPRGREIGFELLGCGPTGESYGKCMQALEGMEAPKEAVKLAFLLPALLTVRHILGGWSDAWPEAKSLVLSVNLDPETVQSGKLDTLMERCLNGFPHAANLVFEVSERFQPEQVEKLLTVVEGFNLSLALDDSDNMKPKVRQRLLAHPRLRFIKHDAMSSRELLKDFGSQPEGTLSQLATFQKRGRWYVIEGVELVRELNFLRNKWKEHREETFLQGYCLPAAGPWAAKLKPVGAEPDCPKGYFILPSLELPTKPTTEPDRGKRRRAEIPSARPEKELLACRLDDQARRSLEDDRSASYPPKDFEAVCLHDESLIRQPALPFLTRWAQDETRPYCVLLGDYGVGKTFVSRMFSRELLALREQKPSLPVPLYCDMRDLPKWDPDRLPALEELIQQVLDSRKIVGITAQETIELIRDNKLLLIMDGFDERACYLTPRQALRVFATLWSVLRLPAETDAIIKEMRAEIFTPYFRGKKAPEKAGWDRLTAKRGKLLLTCRRHFFLDQEDEKSQVAGEAVHRIGYLPGDVLRVYLEGFDSGEVERYVSKRLGEEAGREFLQAIVKVHDLQDLVRRPVLLSYIVQNHADILDLARRGERVTDAYLYETMVRNWLDRDAGKHQIEISTKLTLMQELALLLAAKGETAVHHAELYKWAKPRIQKSNPTVNALLDSVVRQKGPDAAMEWLLSLETDFRTATFIVRDDQGRFAFAHRSFAEFFQARAIADHLGEGREDVLDAAPINRETIDFFLDLLGRAEFEYKRSKISRIIARRLEKNYVAHISENAFRILLRWKQSGRAAPPEPVTIHLDRATLPGVDLSNCRLGALCAADADLSGARFDDVEIESFIAPKADLGEAHFHKARLPGANLREANLNRAEFTHAELAGTRMDRANLAGSIWRDLTWDNTALTGANLNGAEFVRCSFRGADLTDASLIAAGFGRCDLTGARVKGAIFAHTAIAGGQSMGFKPRAARERGIVFLPTKGTRDDRKGINLERFTGHRGMVKSVTISPDGRWIISGGWDETVRVWESASGKLVRTLRGHEGGVNAVAMSPDGQWVVSGSGETVRLWELANGKLVRTLKGQEGWAEAVAVSPDGRLVVSGSDDKMIRIWELANGRLVRTLKGHKDGVYAVTVSPDGRWVVSGSGDKTVCLWEFASGKLARTLKGHEDWVSSIAVSPDARWVVSGSGDGTVRVWELASGRLVRALKGHRDGVCTVTVSLDGRWVVSGSFDQTVRLWELASGKLARTLKEHEDWVSAVAVSPNGRWVVSGSRDQTIHLWELVSGKLAWTLKGREGGVDAVAVSPDGRWIVSGGWDETVRVWESARGKLERTLKGHEGRVNAVAVSPDSRWVVSGSGDKTVRFWELASGKLVWTLKGHEGGVYAVAVSPDGRWVISGGDETVRLWELASGELARTLKGHEDVVSSVAVSPDGRWIVSGSEDKAVHLWEWASGKLVRTLKDYESGIFSVAVSPDGRWVMSGSDDGTVRLWELASGKLERTLKGQEGGVNAVAMSPDGRWVVSGSYDGTVRLWELASGRLKQTLAGNGGAVNQVMFSPDGSELVSLFANSVIRRWDWRKGKELSAIASFPNDQWAAVRDGKVTACSREAWRYLSYSVGLARIPVEAFGDLPVVEDSSVSN
ncbi:MAG: EAL domain-containing protein [Myxococcales bacterium]|nr:MAG: EAL domain-containing protein [Myxococcales bacterium]